MVKATVNEIISVEKRVEAFRRFGHEISVLLERFISGQNEELRAVINQARFENAWYTEKNIVNALKNWDLSLSGENIEKWVHPYYSKLNNTNSGKSIGVVNAGNIPFVGLHDMLSVLICGHTYRGKNATGDSVLLPYLASVLYKIEPAFIGKITFMERLEQFDAVIATGNNNSARYFEFYFKKFPHIIRKNRNGVGVLDGSESGEILKELGNDIFSYFGLGCRNVSKLYVPENYNFKNFFESIYDFKEVMMHSKYMNNFDYNNSVYLLKRISFLQNNFLIVTQESRIASPVSVLYYETYDDINVLSKKLSESIEHIQCIASVSKFIKEDKDLKKIAVDFGTTQSPALWDYADGVNTLEFLTSI